MEWLLNDKTNKIPAHFSRDFLLHHFFAFYLVNSQYKSYICNARKLTNNMNPFSLRNP
nr:MAG TPA: hypothetical protein [Caudoviricetes sp.]